MQTNFTAAQLADTATSGAERILRNCVHCGFCTATCPTYALLGDELDSPRGRIYLIKNMLESNAPATPAVVKHIDRCLSCLSCMTTCPSGVDYMHLVDHGRHYIEKTYKRPWRDRAVRHLLGLVLPRPALFRLALAISRLARPLASVLPGRLSSMLELVPRAQAPRMKIPHVIQAENTRRYRVALMAGCVQQSFAPQINEATVRLLTRQGCEVVVPKGSGCCGAINHHLGQSGWRSFARSNILAWNKQLYEGGLDAIIINASGCGTVVKDYGFMFATDPDLAEPARRISALAKDVTEFITEIGLRVPVAPTGRRVAYHAACSLQHGQRVRDEPKKLLEDAGFRVLDVPEGHLCCGSAGTYNLLQPEIASRLRARKIANIESVSPELVAAGNIGCIGHIACGTRLPVVHTVELLDWATGGPRPNAVAA